MRQPAEFHPVLKACAVLAVVTLPMLLGGAAPKPRSVALPATPTFTEQVDVVRDAQGVPHIFATTASGAFYRLGFASAEDRLFQMNLLRWTMRGRLAEYLDSTQFDLIIDQDKTARILGWGRTPICRQRVSPIPSPRPSSRRMRRG